MKFITPAKIQKLERKYALRFFECPVEIPEGVMKLVLTEVNKCEGYSNYLIITYLIEIIKTNHDELSDAEIYNRIMTVINSYSYTIIRPQLHQLFLHIVAHAHNTLVLNYLKGTNQ